ncbi:DNA polymerase III, delta subunit [Orientia chuto str. Dubai]|uniref:DNA polymerase III, delta subunit n=1 Tax=Orientia chuto str. Dubai TaxID=1359168 RepID=A0A0F3MKX4_9RICK|nr:DNA polymerase III subunit delta' [Candidatus Orientia mediorientalis]KJV56438.1 DNA polymerase III, delta subunit [Orientia chuto str. Dubai]
MLNVLIKNWQNNIFANAWIIDTDNADHALSILLKFCSKIFNYSCNAILQHPDLILVKRESLNDKSKFITVKQIRDMLFFLNKTSIKSTTKVAIIYEAEYMNIHSANCCLKILEDPPLNSYIFLITTKFVNLLSTVRSRCHLLTQKFNNTNIRLVSLFEIEYKNLISMLNDQTNKIQLEFIQKVRSIQLNSKNGINLVKLASHYLLNLLDIKLG